MEAGTRHQARGRTIHADLPEHLGLDRAGLDVGSNRSGQTRVNPDPTCTIQHYTAAPADNSKPEASSRHETIWVASCAQIWAKAHVYFPSHIPIQGGDYIYDVLQVHMVM